jgi:hypothetical protein
MLAFASAGLSQLGCEIDTNVQWRERRGGVTLCTSHVIAIGASDERDSADDTRNKRKAGIAE